MFSNFLAELSSSSRNFCTSHILCSDSVASFNFFSIEFYIDESFLKSVCFILPHWHTLYVEKASRARRIESKSLKALLNVVTRDIFYYLHVILDDIEIGFQKRFLLGRKSKDI